MAPRQFEKHIKDYVAGLAAVFPVAVCLKRDHENFFVFVAINEVMPAQVEKYNTELQARALK